MGATSLNFNNRTTRIPGAYTKIDASGLNSPAPGSAGRVAILGTADGGAPWSAYTNPEDIPVLRGAPALREAFIGGDLKEGAAMAFDPASDASVAGAESVIAVKINPDTQGAVTLTNGAGNSVDVTSRDYGPEANQINLLVEAGTTNGKKISVAYDGKTETFDDVGGLAMLSLQYTEVPTLGWDTMTAEVLASGVRANATRTEAGLSASLANAPLNEVVEAVSSSAADVGQIVTVYGLVGGVPTARQITLNGTTVVADTTAFDAGSVFGVVLDSVCAGTITVQNPTGSLALYSIAPAALAAGGVRCLGMFATGAVSLVADGATTSDVIIAGRNATGQAVLEVVTLNGTTPVAGVATTWERIDFIALADVAGGVNVTLSGTAAQTANAVQSTLRKVADYFNALQVVSGGTTYGFAATLGTTNTSYLAANLDVTTAPVNADSPATAGLNAGLAAFVAALRDGSQFVTAAAASGATAGAPSNTPSPVYLSGGSLGTVTNADWQGALDLIRKADIDTIAVLTDDPAVHAMLSSHVTYRAGPGKAEADSFVGIANAARTGNATLTEVRAQIIAINNRNVRVFAQSFERFNTLGERTTFPAYMGAALLAGAQAGSALGNELTHTYMNVLSFAQDASWNPEDNAEDMLGAGLVFLERVPKQGIRVVRDITSAVTSDVSVFTSGGGNRMLNYMARELRAYIEEYTGDPTTQNTPNAIAGQARKKLKEFKAELGILREWKDLKVVLTGDQSPVSVALAPAIPLVFEPITISLYDAPLAA